VSSSNNNTYSDIKPIQSVISEKLLEINRAGIMVSVKKAIAYGTQLHLEGQGENGLINIFYSKKKGLSFVDCSKNSTSAKTIAVLQGKALSEMDDSRFDIHEREKALNVWIGTDESGKGDFFGPLVAAGFLMRRDMEKELRGLGVADSKTLSSNQIKNIAANLKRKYSKHISIVAPSNIKYNELYESFKNLNKFLAWGHARVIENLVQKWNIEIDGVVSDQFGSEQYIRNALSSMNDLNLIQRPYGESNIAVAAASIIARDTFEKKIAMIQKEYGMKIPFGAGPKVISAAKQFAEKNGKENLIKVVKLHFKTFQQI
jgi:ribonuclease HIII